MEYVRKYRFWEWLSPMPRANRSHTINEMAQVAGVQRRTLMTWIEAPVGSSLVAPLDAVLAICVLLRRDSSTVLTPTAPVAAAPAALAHAA